MKCIMNWVFSQLVSGSFFSSSPPTCGSGFLCAAETKKDEDIRGDSGGTSEPGQDLCHLPIQMHPESSCKIHGKHAHPLSKIENLRCNFSNILIKTGLSCDSLVAKVLYRLHLAILLCHSEEDVAPSRPWRNGWTGAEFSDPHEFSMRILFLGKTGVGKSATVNSIFDEPKVATHAFLPETDHIQEIKGTVNGVTVNIIDVPGLLPQSVENLKKNREILLSVRRFLRRSPPDVVLYFERPEPVSCSGYDDSPLFKLITEVFGRNFWFNTVLVMTNSCSDFPESPHPHGEFYLSRCIDKVRSCIHRAVSTRLENPILLVENNPVYRSNSHLEKLLPDLHQSNWKSRFLLLCLCTKVLADAAAVLEIRNPSRIGGFEIPPSLSLSDLLSSFLDSGGGLPLPDDPSSDDENDSLHEMPPFRVLTKSQLRDLTAPERRRYLRELDYRETLYLKKCIKEEAFRRRENASDPTPLPEMTVSPSFDADCNTHRYRGISTTAGSIITTRPVLGPFSWDHDPGFGGVNVEASKETLSGLWCRAGFDTESLKSDSICTVNGGLSFPIFRCNRGGCGISVTRFRDGFYGGVRVEDMVSVGRRMKLVVGGGGMACGGESGRGGSITGVVTGRDHPARSVFLALTAAVLSDDRAGTALSGRFRLDFRPSWSGTTSVQGELGSRKKGTVSVRFVASEQVEIALVAMMSVVVRYLFRKVEKRRGDI